jgi:hypothetical protein
MRLILATSGAQSGLKYQSLLVNNSWLVRRYSPAPSALDVCACSVTYDCPTAGGSFFCINGNNCTAGTVVWETPGVINSCTGIDSLLNTDLRCFYDQTCLNSVLSMYNVDMPTRLPLPADTLAIPVLNSSAPSRFSPIDTLGSIVEQLMVEEWDTQTDFEGSYETCAPLTCTYTFKERLDLFYVIATLTGLLGGLIVTFRLFVPIGARLIQQTIVYCRNRRTVNNHNNSDINSGNKMSIV